MTPKSYLTLAAALLAAGCATTPEQQAAAQADREAELASALEGRTAGEPQDCLPLSRVDSPNVIGDGVVLYRESGKRIWLARTEGECPALRRDVVLITEVHGSQLCRNDRFRAVDRGARIPGPYCRFGSFTPYDKN